MNSQLDGSLHPTWLDVSEDANDIYEGYLSMSEDESVSNESVKTADSVTATTASGTSKRTKRWCFTLNNYDDRDMAAIAIAMGRANVKYAIFGKEVGAEGTPHLQGYFILKVGKTFTATKRWVGLERVHLEPAIASTKQNIDYCSKEGFSVIYETFDLR